MDELHYSINKKPTQRIYGEKTESSSDQAVNQQVMWIQQTSGIYQIWRTKFKMKMINFFGGRYGYSKIKNNKNIL